MMFCIGDIENSDVINLLKEHHAAMMQLSPADTVHALNIDALSSSDITFWTIWIDQELAGCGALKRLSGEHGEIKSMRTSTKYLRQGVASKMLAHIIEHARLSGLKRVSLETGTHQAFKPAQLLYQSFGFEPSESFGDYKISMHNSFMSLLIE